MNEIENLTPAPAKDPATPTISETTPPAPAPEVTPDPPQPNILTRIVRAIDRALSGNPKRTGHALTLAMIIDVEGGQETWLAKSDLEKLRAWQVRYDKNLKFMLSANPTADWLVHQNNVRDGIEAETTGTLHALSRSEFEKAHQERVEAARLNLEKIYAECFPLCAAIADRVIAIAEKYTAEREARERKEHDYYGVQFSGYSAIVRHFRAAIQYAKMRSTFNQFGRAAPRDIVGYINF